MIETIVKTGLSPKPITFIGFTTGLCGDAIQMMELAAGLHQLGYFVRLIVPEQESTLGFAERCETLGLSIERSPLLRADQMGAKQSLMDLSRLIYRERCSLLHFHTGDLVLPRKALLALRMVKPQQVYVTVHNPSDYIDPASQRARVWVNTVRRAVTGVICPSDHSRQIQRRLGVPDSHLAMIRNGVDKQRFSEGNSANVLQGPLRHLPANAKLVLFTARMEPGKRPDNALEAFQRVAPDDSNAHLVFVGWGSMEQELRDAVRPELADRVHFVGFQTNIQDWLAAATVWLHASEIENCSMALLEALAAGCPIVATMCSGNNEVLRDGQNALTFAPGDIDAFAGALKCLLQNGHRRMQLSEEARCTAQSFSLQRMVSDHLELWQPAQ